MVRSNLVLLPLSWTFKSAGYINPELLVEDGNTVTPFLALAINAIIEEEETFENAHPTVHPCPSNFELNNWIIVEIPIVYKLSE